MKYIIDKYYNALDRADKWDKVTQGVIKNRLEEAEADSAILYLAKESANILKNLVDVLIVQEEVEYVNLAKIINQNLSDKKEGVRYGADPWRGQFYKDGLTLVATDFLKSAGKSFLPASNNEIGDYIKKIMDDKDGEPRIKKFIKKVLADAAFIYYSYPISWNKIGFPGPAYPEGYSHIGCGEAEKWEPKYFKKEQSSD